MVTPSLCPSVVEFFGPFSWTGSNAPSVFEAPMAAQSGIYLWTVQVSDGELIYYVGETGRSFITRMQEHLKEHLAGGYHLYRLLEFSAGKKVPLWKGLYGLDREPSLSEFLKRYLDLVPAIGELSRTYRFFLAPIQEGRRERERIEAAIASTLYSHNDPLIRQFQDTGIRYRPRWTSETPETVALQAHARLLGLPTSMQV
jgi:hypothetical protein